MITITKLNILTLILPALVVLTPSTSNACPAPNFDTCVGADFWSYIQPINAVKIPADGVVVLQGEHHEADEEDPLKKIEITVTKDDQPLAGTLEATAQQGLLIWRPDASWEPGATYQMKGVVSNPALPDGCYKDAPMMLPFGDQLHIDAAKGAAIGPTEFTGEAQLNKSQEVTLATVACCPGTLPEYFDLSGCGDLGVHFQQGTCTPTTSRSRLVVQIVGEPAAPGPAGNQLLYRLKVDGTLHSSGTQPTFYVDSETAFCAVIEAEDLANGTITTSEEQCFGQDIAGQLGQFPLDPVEELDCELQQCEVLGNTWDPTKCAPFEPGTSPTSSDATTDPATDASGDTGEGQDGDAQGCACDATPVGGAGLLTLLGPLALLGAARRRRARA